MESLPLTVQVIGRKGKVLLISIHSSISLQSKSWKKCGFHFLHRFSSWKKKELHILFSIKSDYLLSFFVTQVAHKSNLYFMEFNMWCEIIRSACQMKQQQHHYGFFIYIYIKTSNESLCGKNRESEKAVKGIVQQLGNHPICFLSERKRTLSLVYLEG